MRGFLAGAFLLVSILIFGCSSNSADKMTGPSATAAKTSESSAAPVFSVSSTDSTGGSLNGAAGEMPAYYDSTRFTINLMDLSAQAAATIIARNQSFNTIYMSDPGLPGGKPFISVLDAIQGDGFNPLWREVQIAFNPGFTPRQFFSDDEILAAAGGAHPEITLTKMNEIYRCAVVGAK